MLHLIRRFYYHWREAYEEEKAFRERIEEKLDKCIDKFNEIDYALEGTREMNITVSEAMDLLRYMAELNREIKRTEAYLDSLDD